MAAKMAALHLPQRYVGREFLHMAAKMAALHLPQRYVGRGFLHMAAKMVAQHLPQRYVGRGFLPAIRLLDPWRPGWSPYIYLNVM